MIPQIRLSCKKLNKIVENEGMASLTELLNDALLENVPSESIKTLDQMGILKFLIPEFIDLKGIEYINGVGHKDVYYHTLRVLDNIRPMTSDLNLLWSAFLHDIGKSKVKLFDKDHGWRFNYHDVIGSDMAVVILDRLGLGNKLDIPKIKKLIRLHMKPSMLVSEDVTDSAVRRLITESEPYLDDLMKLAKADLTTNHEDKKSKCLVNLAKLEDKLQYIKDYDVLRTFKNPLNGNYIMEVYNIPPCNMITVLKDYVRDAILAGTCDYTFEAADALMRVKAKELGLVAVK